MTGRLRMPRARLGPLLATEAVFAPSPKERDKALHFGSPALAGAGSELLGGANDLAMLGRG